MIFVEGLLWTPVVFLLTLPVLGRDGPVARGGGGDVGRRPAADAFGG